MRREHEDPRVAVEGGAHAASRADGRQDRLDHVLVRDPAGNAFLVEPGERPRLRAQLEERRVGDRVGNEVEHVLGGRDRRARLQRDAREADPRADDDERARRRARSGG